MNKPKKRQIQANKRDPWLQKAPLFNKSPSIQCRLKGHPTKNITLPQVDDDEDEEEELTATGLSDQNWESVSDSSTLIEADYPETEQMRSADISQRNYSFEDMDIPSLDNEEMDKYLKERPYACSTPIEWEEESFEDSPDLLQRALFPNISNETASEELQSEVLPIAETWLSSHYLEESVAQPPPVVPQPFELDARKTFKVFRKSIFKKKTAILKRKVTEPEMNLEHRETSIGISQEKESSSQKKKGSQILTQCVKEPALFVSNGKATKKNVNIEITENKTSKPEKKGLKYKSFTKRNMLKTKLNPTPLEDKGVYEFTLESDEHLDTGGQSSITEKIRNSKLKQKSKSRSQRTYQEWLFSLPVCPLSSGGPSSVKQQKLIPGYLLGVDIDSITLLCS